MEREEQEDQDVVVGQEKCRTETGIGGYVDQEVTILIIKFSILMRQSRKTSNLELQSH